MTFMTSAWHNVTSITITNCFGKVGIRHDDHWLFAFDDPLAEVSDIFDVIKVDMSRMRTTAITVNDFVSPTEELIQEEEVTLEQLLETYRPLSVPDEDDSEVQPKIRGNEARDALSLLKLYV